MAALKGAKTPEDEFAKRKAVIAEIERESLQKTGLRSDVVTLYQGGEYWLYRYKKYTDVRLVFAPEEQAAFFGGDPDNFTYPRYDLDMALFRVYENGKPIETKDYLKWNPQGAKNEELVFVAGHPGSTSRLDTLAQLELERDVVEPNVLKILRHRIDVLRKYSALGAEQARQAESEIFDLENSLKAYEGASRAARQERDGQKAQGRRGVPRHGDGQPRVEGGLRRRLGRDREGREESRYARPASGASTPPIPSLPPLRPTSCSTWPRSRSRTASGCPASTRRSSNRCASRCSRPRRSIPRWRSRA